MAKNIPKDAVCPICLGKKMVWKMVNGKKLYVKCSDCNGTGIKTESLLKDLNLYNLTEKDASILEELIPNRHYRDKEFSKRDALRDRIYRKIPMEKRGLTYETMLNFMEELLDSLAMGIAPEKSYFIFSPFDKVNKTFVYNAIKNAFVGNLEPSKLLNVHDIYGKLDKADYAGIDEQINGKGILFLEIPYTYSTKNWNGMAIKYLADYCENKGIPLIAISAKRSVSLESPGQDKVDGQYRKYIRMPDYISLNTHNYEYGTLEDKSIGDDLSWAWYDTFKVYKEAQGDFDDDGQTFADNRIKQR